MPREFQMREFGTGKVLGSIRTVEDVPPGQLVGMFKRDEVQVEVVRHEAADETGARKRRGAKA